VRRIDSVLVAKQNPSSQSQVKECQCKQGHGAMDRQLLSFAFSRQQTQLILEFNSSAMALACPKTNVAMCRWVVSAGEYTQNSVGSKCYTLASLAKSLPSCIATPASAAVPYAALPRALDRPDNAAAKAAASADASDSRGPHPAVSAVEQVRMSVLPK
jgi:hypothetical protein